MTDTIRDISTQWVEELQRRLMTDGRALEGGWPGTISEARRRLYRHLSAGTAAVSREQCAQMASDLYADAKSRWARTSTRVQPTPVDCEDS